MNPSGRQHPPCRTHGLAALLLLVLALPVRAAPAAAPPAACVPDQDELPDFVLHWRFPFDTVWDLGFVYLSEGAELALDPGVAMAGGASLRITTPGPATVRLARVREWGFPGRPLSLHLDVTVLASRFEGEIEAAIRTRNDQLGPGHRSYPVTLLGSEWSTRMAQIFPERPGEPETLLLDLDLRGQGTVWIDSASLYRGPAAGPGWQAWLERAREGRQAGGPYPQPGSGVAEAYRIVTSGSMEEQSALRFYLKAMPAYLPQKLKRCAFELFLDRERRALANPGMRRPHPELDPLEFAGVLLSQPEDFDELVKYETVDALATFRGRSVVPAMLANADLLLGEPLPAALRGRRARPMPETVHPAIKVREIRDRWGDLEFIEAVARLLDWEAEGEFVLSQEEKAAFRRSLERHFAGLNASERLLGRRYVPLLRVLHRLGSQVLGQEIVPLMARRLETRLGPVERLLELELLASFKPSGGAELLGRYLAEEADPKVRTYLRELVAYAGGARADLPAPRPPVLLAQQPSGRRNQLRGSVFGPHGAEGGVSVRIEGTEFETTTAADGSFALDYAPGMFTMVFAKPGFLTAREEMVIEPTARPSRLYLTLQKVPPGPGIYVWKDSPLASGSVQPGEPAGGRAGARYCVAEGQPVEVDTGNVAFTDAQNRDLRLARLGEGGAIPEPSRKFVAPVGDDLEGFVEDRVEELGAEKLRRRLVTLYHGRYAWVEMVRDPASGELRPGQVCYPFVAR